MQAIFSQSRKSHTKVSAGPLSDSGQELMARRDMRTMQAGTDGALVNCWNTWSPVSQDLPEPAALFFWFFLVFFTFFLHSMTLDE